jgi:hypothetical protein
MRRQRKPKTRQLGYEPDPELAHQQIVDLVHELNETRIPVTVSKNQSPSYLARLGLSEKQTELRRLVESWKASGPNLRKMFEQEPDLQLRTKKGKTVFYSTPTGRGHLEWLACPSENDHSFPKDDALKEFMTLITNPDWDLLGGPCPRCDNYFLKKTRRKNIYCSRTCSSTATAIPAIRRKRQQEQAKKVAIAQKYIDEWGKSKRRSGWKKWVSIETGYTDRWLTRAINGKTLSAPKTNDMCLS